MRKYKSLQTWCQSTSATYTSLPREVSKKLLNFALEQLRQEQKRYKPKYRFISGAHEYNLPVKVNGVMYTLKNIHVSYSCKSISIYYIGRGRKLRISDHWCYIPSIIIGYTKNKYCKTVPVFATPNRGTSSKGENLKWMSRTGHTTTYIKGADNSFVVKDETITFCGDSYGLFPWKLGSRVFEGGWVPFKNIEITRGPNCKEV